MKHFKNTTALSLSLLASALLLSGCLDSSSSSSDDTNKTTETRNLDVRFTAINSTANNQDITSDVCGATFNQVGTEPVDLSVADMAFYLHNLELITSTGSSVPVTLNETQWQEEGVALIDFQNKDTRCTGDTKPINTEVLGEYQHAEATEYTGLRFTVGLPAELNHALPRPSTGILARSDLQWGWAAGYKYLRMDTYPEGGIANHNGNTANAWAFHLGATGCNTDQDDNKNFIPGTTVCENSYLMQVELQDVDISNPEIWVDLAAVLAGSNMTKNEGGAVGCMSFDNAPVECGPVFERLGLTYSGIEDHEAGEQVLFRLPD